MGGNLPGEYDTCEALLEAALARFPEIGLTVVRRSSWIRSEAWPDPMAPEYANGVAIVETDLSPWAVMGSLLELERAFGRVRSERNAPRTLDLDLIAYGRVICREPDLVLPHPRAHERAFVMRPLAEIAPDWTHPMRGETATVGAERLRKEHSARL